MKYKSAGNSKTSKKNSYFIGGDVLPIQPLSSRASDKGNDGSDILRGAQTIVWVLL